MTNNLRGLRSSHGWSPEFTARQMSMSEGGYIKLERGERQLTEATIRKAMEVFGVTADFVLGVTSGKANRKDAEQGYWSEHYGPLSEPPTNSDTMPVYLVMSGEAGTFKIGKSGVIARFPRPHLLEGVYNAYGILPFDAAMSPVYRGGMHVLVNPWLDARTGEVAVFYRRDLDERGYGTGLLRQVVEVTNRGWILRRYSDGETQEIDRKDWPRSHRVIGQFSARSSPHRG